MSNGVCAGYYSCPYFMNKDINGIHCEGGIRISLPMSAEKWVIENYCRSPDARGWEGCTVAQALSMHYERFQAKVRGR